MSFLSSARVRVFNEHPPYSYVDPNNVTGSASDSNDGLTPSTPWLTMQKAATAAPIGVCFIRQGNVAPALGISGSGGDVLLNGVVRPAKLTFKPYPSETVKLVAGSLGTGQPVLAGCRNIAFDGVDVYRTTLTIGNYSAGAYCNDITISNADFTGTGALPAGMSILGTSGQLGPVVVEDFDVTATGENLTGSAWMFYMAGTSAGVRLGTITIRRGVFHDILNFGPMQANHFDNLLIEDITGHAIRRQVTGASPDPHIDGLQTPFCSAGNLTVRRFRYYDYDNSALRIDANVGLDSVLIENCAIGSASDASTSVATRPFGNLQIVGNTIDGSLNINNNGDTAVFGSGPGPKMLNTVALNFAKHASVAMGYEDYNCIPTYSGGSRGTHSIATDPIAYYTDRANGNFKPTTGSPLIGAGALTGGSLTVPSTDFLGVARGNPPAIGAYQP